MTKRFTKQGFIIALICLIADQLSKWYMLEVVNIREIPPIEVTSFFNLVMVWNPGISFGMFQSLNYSHYIFAGLSFGISILLAIWLTKAETRLTAVSIGLIIGGALGNMIDRLVYGAVADFFDLHIAGHHWPAFNIADSTVFVGAMLLCIDSFLPKHSNAEHETL